jgi:protein phosphatase
LPWGRLDVTDTASQAAGVQWWEELTSAGGEGMVVKPFEFIAKGRRGLAQPAVKCRGREYLRILYGPEYTTPENLESLKSRGLSAKRSLASREFALGIEGLERFVRHEPLRRVYECVFGVLALESEPVDLANRVLICDTNTSTASCIVGLSVPRVAWTLEYSS